MRFELGERLRADGEVYKVVGKVVYRACNDIKAEWTEYRLISEKTGREKWLSYDDIYREYSICEVVSANVSTAGYHVVDDGVEEVIRAEGDVDVERGDQASFTEYEDSTEEKIISIERWDDGEEVSIGYYLDYDEIQKEPSGYQYAGGMNGGTSGFVSGNTYTSSGYRGTISQPGSSSAGKIVAAIAGVAIAIPILGSVVGALSNSNSISKYLEKSSAYEYTTSITGSENEKATVYQTDYSIDTATKDIIDAINGDTIDVQQNEEDGDNTVTILTDKEYCIIYTSEDNETLVQVSTRKYMYYNDDDLYHGSRYSNRYYRRHYYSRGYSADTSTYGGYSSPYSSYSGDTLSSDSNSTYNTYSSSVRQSSVSSRTSSGGGTSSGK